MADSMDGPAVVAVHRGLALLAFQSFQPFQSFQSCNPNSSSWTPWNSGTIGTVTAVEDGDDECYHRAMWHSIPLTSFWFVYFGSLGIFFPYFSLYLRENAGLSGTQVGLVLAISPLVGMFAQPVWGQIADRTGARTRALWLFSPLALRSAISCWAWPQDSGRSCLRPPFWRWWAHRSFR